METKRTNKDILVKGVKKIAVAIAFMFIGPSILYVAFSNQEKPLYIPLLILGGAVCIAAIIFAFKGLNTIMDSLFHKK
ncbi:hypothetical protein ES677_10850 [Bizionia gelidisalsuginis]|uniref:Uncharacterized protein n=2 Tax=Bizionia TaxID=283785 RepID=A0A8H2QE94_9FLAO|nr:MULTISPECIES: DUF6095 family protein [Bizionia]TYB71474.1 hypothetical protein ES676_12460 [Bizionia saleffrena]TYC10807.1 hypothetical protein ES677_10850 [Bizionia gelidisalsuginis]